mmetsp:Transcript_8471/g.12934  ORF Transcript_8471/g.12934 Transcript_8471/m.12934 type:complete len:143 (-) Transcript_8471:183-611(-)
MRLGSFLLKYATANLDKIIASRERQLKLEEKKRESKPKKKSRKQSNAQSPIDVHRRKSRHLKAPSNKPGDLSISIQKTEGFDSLELNKRDSQVEEPSISDSEVDSLQAMREAIDNYGVFDFYSEFKHLSNCLQICAKDYSMH